MFRIYFINFGYYSANEAADLVGAKKIAQTAGFQSRVEDANGDVVATYCPAFGWTVHNWEIWREAA